MPNSTVLLSPPARPCEPQEESVEESANNPESVFQAIGIVRGTVDFNDKEQQTITVAQQQYPLLYSPQYRQALAALKNEVKKTGKTLQRLIVYPKIVHFPKRDTPHELMFQVVGFDVGQPREGTLQLEDMEFYLRGLWQFIPVCKTPCISVFRNFSLERLEYIKQAEPKQRVNFMRPSHVPILWRDAPVKPFRFNPKTDKEQQGSPVFVQVKAKFLPSRNLFGFDALLQLPMEKPPKFLKVSKADKQAALQAARD